LIMVATLPLVEAPKNLAWLAFVVLWLINSLRQRNFGSMPRVGSAALAGVFVSTLVAIALGAEPRQWGELGNMVVYLVLGALLGRTRCSERQVGVLLAVALAATLAGVGLGLWLQLQGKRQWLELYSVGHVNHSALYGAGIALLALAAVLAWWPHLNRRGRLCGAALNVLLFYLMFAWSSRGALLAYLAGGLLLGALTLWINPAVIDKTRANLAGTSSSLRIAAARTALEIWRQQPLTGIGAGNFKVASPAGVEAWVRARNEPFVAADYLFSNHAHSLYFNTLAERGALGVLALALLCAWWLGELLRRRPRATSPAAQWLGWGTGWAGFSVVWIGGLFNTSLHHEHGMLALACLGILIGSTPRRRAEA